MKRFLALSIFIVLSSISMAQASIRLTEIAWMGTTESSFCEWFELYNDGTDAVNLAGWKLYEDNGNQTIFTLTKSVNSQGYLLVERTTPSCPDPVPNVNDEAGSFGGSGFSNTGENLLLKDAQGSIIQMLDFSSGWPAGDATTKQTMQWNGSGWVTATATPKAPASGGGEVDLPPQSNPSTAWSAPQVVPHIELNIPKTIYATVASEYSQKTFLEYGEAYNGVFLWNMGDGTVYKSDRPSNVNHTYKYPGDYTITFAYYRTPYDTKPILFESQERPVISPTVSLRIISGKGFEFSNSGSTTVDLSGWVVVLPDTTVELPPFTIIAPKKIVLMPFGVFGLSTSYKQGTLQTPQRVAVSSSSNSKEIIPLAKSNVIYNVDPTASVSSLSSLAEASVIGALPETEKKTKIKPQTKTVIFVGALLIVIALFLLLERFVGSQGEKE